MRFTVRTLATVAVPAVEEASEDCENSVVAAPGVSGAGGAVIMDPPFVTGTTFAVFALKGTEEATGGMDVVMELAEGTDLPEAMGLKTIWGVPASSAAAVETDGTDADEFVKDWASENGFVFRSAGVTPQAA